VYFDRLVLIFTGMHEVSGVAEVEATSEAFGMLFFLVSFGTGYSGFLICLLFYDFFMVLYGFAWWTYLLEKQKNQKSFIKFFF